jgi:hypothetical protein
MTVHIRLTRLYTWCDLFIIKGLKTNAFDEKGT